MRKHNCKKIVFSSSATVYGMNNVSPLTEDMQVGGVTNPYGRTKYIIECMLQDLYASDNSWSICLLRYFNPIGAHKSGTMGEDPNGIPNNLMPYITQVAIGKLDHLNVFGDDYDTPDGTGVRDYIHVVDLALGHVKAVEKVKDNEGLFIYNLGTGIGYSVLDVVHAFEKASGKKIPYEIQARRSGDIATCYSDPSKALSELGWKAQRGIEEMCEDSWRWQSQNPNGYPD
jgi:UDP-glucose 4-epimerase